MKKILLIFHKQKKETVKADEFIKDPLGSRMTRCGLLQIVEGGRRELLTSITKDRRKTNPSKGAE